MPSRLLAMIAMRSPIAMRARLDALRTELADLAFDLERQGCFDAADVAMILDARMREMTEEILAENPSEAITLVRSAEAERLLLP
jgi:hypothetical protein